MKQVLFALAILLGLVAQRANASLVTSLYNTGVDGGGNVLANGTIGDPHYTLTLVPALSTTTTLIRTSAGNYPIPPYLGDDALSTWIGPNNDAQLDGPGGTYIYHTTFDLTGLNPASAQITGNWTTDNAGVDILINGLSTGSSIPYDAGGGNYSFLSFHAFNISSGFQPGINTLDFEIMNGNGGSDQFGPTAVRVEMTGTASVVPESSSLAVWGLLGLCIVGLCWRRKW